MSPKSEEILKLIVQWLPPFSTSLESVSVDINAINSQDASLMPINKLFVDLKLKGSFEIVSLMNPFNAAKLLNASSEDAEIFDNEYREQQSELAGATPFFRVAPDARVVDVLVLVLIPHQ